jgi:hypothetical protein
MLAATVAVGAPVAAQAPELAMLRTLETGQWQLRDRDSSSPPISLCVRDPKVLLQLRHRYAVCTRFIVEDGAGSVTVQYSCPGAGNGRTTVRRETSRLVQIDTQGIAGGAPFNTAYEGRYVGACR